VNIIIVNDYELVNYQIENNNTLVMLWVKYLNIVNVVKQYEWILPY